jgi:hypothetical protein
MELGASGDYRRRHGEARDVDRPQSTGLGEHCRHAGVPFPWTKLRLRARKVAWAISSTLARLSQGHPDRDENVPDRTIYFPVRLKKFLVGVSRELISKILTKLRFCFLFRADEPRN